MSNRRSGVCFHHRRPFFYPWGVSFETLCNTLLWWILYSLIHSVQTVTLSLSFLMCRGTAAAPLASLGARTKTSAQALFDYGNNLSKSCNFLEWSTPRHVFYSFVLFYQRQCTDADIAAHICEGAQTICLADSLCEWHRLCCIVWRTTCRLDLSLCKLLYQGPTRFSWHGAKEPAAHKQVDCYFFMPLLLRGIQGSFMSVEWRVGAGENVSVLRRSASAGEAGCCCVSFRSCPLMVSCHSKINRLNRGDSMWNLKSDRLFSMRLWLRI